jgi:endonuclease-3
LTKNEYDKISEIDKKLVKHFGVPPRKNDSDPVDMMIGTILSQNTNDNNSYKAFKKLKERFPDWEKLESADINEVIEIIRVAGLPKQKAAAILNFVKTIKEKFGKLDLSYYEKLKPAEAVKELSSLRGVGVKTASCLLLFSFKKNICPVDTHVHRTLNRIGLVKTTTPEKTFWKINDGFPPNIAHRFHTNLIKLGRTYCIKNPKCGNCPVANLCEYKDKTGDRLSTNRQETFLLLDNI